MAIYYDANQAQEGPRTLIPDMPGYSEFKKKPFAAMRTEQDQIWWLYWWLVVNGFEKEDWDALVDRVSDLEASQAAQDERMDIMQAQIDELRAQMCALAQNALVYDVTRGVYAPSIAAARRSWQAQMFLGMTVADLATYTVEEASLLNVRHVAVDGREEYMRLGDADPEIPEQGGYACASFNPDEYVKKSDLTLIDTDNLEAKNIMGVLTADAASDYVSPAPYVRKGTATDLASLLVRFDSVMLSGDEDGKPGEP